MSILRRARIAPILLALMILSFIGLGRFRAAPQLAPANLNQPTGVGPALTSPGTRVAWLSGLGQLSDARREDDFPSIAVAQDGMVWSVWASYSGLYDEIRARCYRNGAWTTSFPIPGITGDVWMPQVAIDATGTAWFVWSQQVDYPTRDPENVRWNLYAVSMEGSRWGKLQRLTTEAGPDLNQRLKRDASGRIWLVWQGFRSGRSSVFLKYLDEGQWSQTYPISDNSNDNWYPDVAVDSKGTAYVAWDTYRKDSFDLVLRTFREGQLGVVENIAATPDSEANAAVAVDKQDRVWIAYDQMGVNWGKDNGAVIRANQPGIQLNHTRQVHVVVRTPAGLVQPAEQPSEAMPANDRENNELPRLYCDKDGRMWITMRHKTERPATWSRPWQVNTEQVQGVAAVRGFWETYVTYYDGKGWIAATQVPHSKDRISSYSDLAPAPNGQMWAVWHTDNRPDDQVQIPVKNDIWTAVFTPATPARDPDLASLTIATPALAKPGHVDEAGDVQTIREHRILIGGVEHRIMRGDLHRHTELSTDGGGRADGSLVDFMRYMFDAARMDFGAITDHNAGGDNEYWWWYTNKLTDLYHVPGRYTAMFGYERSATYPNGHRNIIHPYRNIPVVKFHFRSDVPEYWSTYEAASRDMVDNETQQLYEHIRRTGGIAISHTSGTNMGTDWRDNDKDLEPVVELYQGCRTSYEHEGAPRSAKAPANADEPQSAYRREGYVWNALKKGYRLGFEASSDHNSTHISYTMVVTDKPTRLGIMDAIRKRHTYGATDNIMLEFWAGDHFMGDEFHSATVPPLRVKVRGTSKIAKVSIIRNQKYVYEAKPDQQEVALEYRDSSPDAGTNYYYARIEQADGQIAWASPIWVVR
jgi:hypothetical protein